MTAHDAADGLQQQQETAAQTQLLRAAKRLSAGRFVGRGCFSCSLATRTVGFTLAGVEHLSACGTARWWVAGDCWHGIDIKTQQPDA